MKTTLAKIVFALALAGTTLPALADGQIDVGQASQASLEQVIRRSVPIRRTRAELSDAAPFRRHAPAHIVSFDAGAVGCRLGPRTPIGSRRARRSPSTGQPVKLSRPLDFLVVADHSDNMGFFPDLLAGEPELLANPQGRKWYDMIKAGTARRRPMEIVMSFRKGSSRRRFHAGHSGLPLGLEGGHQRCGGLNDPGQFTAFIGYEWTSNAKGNNLHRNVIFRDNGDKASLSSLIPHAAIGQQQSRGFVEMDGC